MTEYGQVYELAKERHMRLLQEAKMARLVMETGRARSVSSSLKSLLVLLFPLT